MDPIHHPELYYPTYNGSFSQQPLRTDFGFEAHRSSHQYYPHSLVSHYPRLDCPFDLFPRQKTAPYNPLAISPVEGVWNQLPTEHGRLTTDRRNSTGTISVQPQRAYLSFADNFAIQTIQSDTINEDDEFQERRQTLLELVPQNLYRSPRHQAEFVGPDLIAFAVGGKQGVRLSDALEGNWEGFKGGDDRSLFEGTRGQILIRFHFVGCPRWHSKVSIVDFTAKRRPITRKKLVVQVARNIQKFIAREKLSGHDGGHPRCRWGGMLLERVFLTRMFRVSIASWQPEIFVERALPASQAVSSASSSTNTPS